LSNHQSDLLNGVDAVKGAAKKALAAQEQSLEHSAQTASALQGLKQVRPHYYCVRAFSRYFACLCGGCSVVACATIAVTLSSSFVRICSHLFVILLSALFC
jgi:hypothetical protein